MDSARLGRRFRIAGAAVVSSFVAFVPALQARAADADASSADQPVTTAGRSPLDVRGLSLDELVNVPVTSASKHEEPITQAPASIYVITHERIIRTGAQSIPEILRLAPNLQVYQKSSSDWVVTARGLNGNNQAQSFSNKLLVLIDGRTVYTPLFSGVYWDLQQVPIDDIDRIEVISGPGATLWGANAVNGVINIITRRASDTPGALVDVTNGNFQKTAAVQYGGSIGENLQYRVYGSTFWYGDTRQTDGTSAHDRWTKPQGGARLDWTASPHDLVTVQGDIYGGKEAEGVARTSVTGGNVTSRWTHTGDDGGVLQVQAFMDRFARGQTRDSGSFSQDTYDLDVQDSLAPMGRHHLVVGGGVRSVRYEVNSNGALIFSPYSRDLRLGNLFAQDTVSLRSDLDVVLGLKLEDDPYVGMQVLPNLRANWRATPTVALWGAVSRAVRSATPFDDDVIEKVGGEVFLAARSSFRPEALMAYEMGARFHPASGVNLSVSTYYDAYDHLRSIEPTPGTFVPIYWGNKIRGDIYGVEAWAGWDVRSWWRLGATLNALHEDLTFAPGASQLLGVAQAGDDPPFQASLRSAVSIGQSITWDANLRYVDALPAPVLPAYTELNTSVGWRFAERFRVSVSGFNLLHAYHREYVGGFEIPRSLFAEIRTWF